MCNLFALKNDGRVVIDRLPLETTGMIREVCCHTYTELCLSTSYPLWIYSSFHEAFKKLPKRHIAVDPAALAPHPCSKRARRESSTSSLNGLNVVVILEAAKDQIIDRT